jgi:hypothetical protein
MLFIYPMWDNQSQRIGKQKCTPLGYVLHCFAIQLGSLGLVLIFALSLYLGYRGITGSFYPLLFGLLAIPFGVGITAQILFLFSWHLAYKKGFEYDYEEREASWLENGVRVTYNFALDTNRENTGEQ